MRLKIAAFLFVGMMAFAFTGCSGGLLSQRQMDDKIEALTKAGEEELLPTLESACDQKFEALVQNYADSLMAASAVSEE
ncbi:MAG: hypothetical protein AAF502_04230 [Bacteroidota bacterium]